MKSILASIAPVFLLTIQSFAQSDFRTGIVIDLNSDTIQGSIDYRGDLIMSSECRFRSASGETFLYEPGEILAYQFLEEGKFYQSKVYEGKAYFMEFLVNGELDLFYLRNEGSERYFVEKDSFPLKELPYEEGLKIRDGKSYRYKSNIHRGILKIYMQDAPQMQAQLDQLGKPGHNNMIKLAKNYHKIVCENEACIVYEKKTSPFKLALELQTSYFMYSAGSGFRLSTSLDYVSTVQQGLILHLWMPRTSEKLFLRTGLIVMDYGSSESSGLAYKFPLMLEYLYPKYRIRPRFAAGMNFYNPFIQTVAFLGGVNVLITDRLHLTAHYEIESVPPDEFPLLPRYNFGSNLGAGVYFRF